MHSTQVVRPASGRKWIDVAATGVVGLVLSAVIGGRVLTQGTTQLDNSVRAWILAHQVSAVRNVFYAITVVGAPDPMILLAIAGAVLLWWVGRPRAALAVLVAPVGAMAAYELVKRGVGRARPPQSVHLIESGYSFPSAHATAATAICCTLAYVFWQEGWMSGGAALALAAVGPVLVGISRVYLDVHWTTDVLGGWSAGVTVAALSMALYQQMRRAS